MTWYPPGKPVPQTEEDRFEDQWWRLNNLYQVIDTTGTAMRFVPNPVQVNYYWSQWYLNLILKSRQHGYTTFLCLIALDLCIWRENYHAHLIAQTREDSERLFNDKILWPLKQLQAEFPELAESIETEEENARVLTFPNGSTFSCGTSMRGGTLQWLHISEHGKICAQFPHKAKEIRTGALNTVHAGQCITIESTAEGRQGDFYEFAEAARKRCAVTTPNLSVLDFKFHFTPWWRDRKNTLNPTGVVITDRYAKYFAKLAKNDGIKLTPGQKAWYVKKAETQRDLMYREHPSTPEEAFQGATEGTYFGAYMLKAREQGRIVPFIPFETRLPVDTSWDLGKNDENAIWLHQWVRALGIHRWLYYIEGHSNGPAEWMHELEEIQGRFGFKWGKHYLPHDVEVSDWSQAKGKTRKDLLEDLGMRNIVVVERVPNIIDGIDAVKLLLPVSQFSEQHCAQGITHLENYRREYDEKTESHKDTPLHNPASNGADAFRQLAQEWFPDTTYRQKKPRERNWRRA